MRCLMMFALALAIVAGFPVAAMAARISEFSPDPVGRDGSTQQFEISGIAGMSFTGFVLSISGSQTRSGIVETAEQVSGTFDPNGLITLEIGDLVNPTNTVVLIDDFDGIAKTTDIDENNDGVADDLSSIQGIRDAFGIADSSADESRLFGTQLGGENLSFTGDQPYLVFRDASVGNWYAINDPDGQQIFNQEGVDIAEFAVFDRDPFLPSFGFINPTVVVIPEPNLLVALAWGTAIASLRRNRRAKK